VLVDHVLRVFRQGGVGTRQSTRSRMATLLPCLTQRLSSLLGQKVSSLFQLGPTTVCMVAESQQFGVVGFRLLAVPGILGSLSGTTERVVTIGCSPQRSFEFRKCWGRLLQSEQHLTEKLSGGQDDSWSNGVLVRAVFMVGRLTHLLESFMRLPLCQG